MLTALMFCSIAPQAAFATPPDVIDIHDEPFGLSATHLYVLRTTHDNLGLYETSRIETFLVAIDLETSAEEYWPVYRGLRTVQYSEDGEPLGVVVKADSYEGPAVSVAGPFGILEKRGGIPWGALQTSWRVDPDPEAIADADGFNIDQESHPRLTLERSTLAARLAATSAAIPAQISNYPRMSNLQTRDLFAERTIDQSTCRPDQVYQPVFPFDAKVVTVVRFICNDEDDLGSSSLMQLFPATLDTRAR